MVPGRGPSSAATTVPSGIVTGRGLGASASAALTTRGFAELMRFGKAFGARSETLTGLSGLGDLILTCSSPQSRNFSLGVAIGKGEAPAAASHGALAEGAFTAAVLVDMAIAKDLEMLKALPSVDIAITFSGSADWASVM